MSVEHTVVGKIIQDTMDRMKAQERTLMVRPEDEQLARIMARGLPFISIKVSNFIPAGQAILLDLNALEML